MTVYIVGIKGSSSLSILLVNLQTNIPFLHFYTQKLWNHDFTEYVSWFYTGTVVYLIWSRLRSRKSTKAPKITK